MKTYILHNLIGDKTDSLDDDGQPLQKGFHAMSNWKKSTDVLLGLCEGVLADGRLNDEEIEFLNGWIGKNTSISNDWPASVIAQNLKFVLSDGIVDEAERQELKELLKSVCSRDDSGRQTATTLPLDRPPPTINFLQRCFCLTGKFITGTRKTCEGYIATLGGLLHPRVTTSVDYMVIGTLASRDWKHTSHGTKIEAAIESRDKGNSISIVSEEHWVSHLEKLRS